MNSLNRRLSFGRDQETIVRRRQTDDIDACVELLSTVHDLDDYPMWWPTNPRDWLEPEALLMAWVAECDHALVGHAALCEGMPDWGPSRLSAIGVPPHGIAEVTRLFVAAMARRHGLAYTLLAKACSEAKSRGLHAVLDVLDADRAAIALYERAGWVRIASSPATWAVVAGEPLLLHSYISPK